MPATMTDAEAEPLELAALPCDLTSRIGLTLIADDLSAFVRACRAFNSLEARERLARGSAH